MPNTLRPTTTTQATYKNRPQSTITRPKARVCMDLAEDQASRSESREVESWRFVHIYINNKTSNCQLLTKLSRHNGDDLQANAESWK